MEVQEVKEQLKNIFRTVINNNKANNWNEQDHPRDEQGRFTFKYRGATVDVATEGKYSSMKIYAPEGETFKNGDTWYYTEAYTDKAEEHAKKIIDGEFGFSSDNKAENNKETEMALLDELKKLITKVENDKGEENMTIDNEKVDKRDIIRQIMAIAGKEEASEDVRTIAKLAEKLAYDKSEAGTADNEKDDKKEECDNKKEVKNEDGKDEKKVKEIKEEVKEDVKNKCKNSVDNSKPDYFGRLNEIYNAATSNIEQKTEYVSRADREKAAEDYFAR